MVSCGEKNKLEYDSVSITNAYYQPIAAVIDKIKYRPPSAEEIVGRVKKLHAAPDAEKRNKGTIIISYIGSDDKSHNITTTLKKLIMTLQYTLMKIYKSLGESNKTRENRLFRMFII